MSFRVRILDEDALRLVAPAALRAYAVSQGWRRTESFGEHSDVYVLEGADEAIIPASASLADYARAVSDVLGLFAIVEERDELQIYRDLSTADQDVIRLRAPEAEDDGSVRLETGVDLVVHARDLLLSAACSASNPRPTYRAGRNRAANEYLSRVRLGQTERGSFIVTMLSPVPPALESAGQPTLWPMASEEPFERKVTRRLAQGLMAAKGAIEKTNRGEDFTNFEQAVPQGVSANLCEATARLIERGDGLDVSVTWARTRRTPEDRRIVSFTESDGDVLKEAARVFRDREPRPDETLEGFIIKLARDEDETDGRVTLRAAVDSQFVSVGIDLRQVEYDYATRAHENKQAISITGDLLREGHRWRLRHPREIVVVEADEDDD